MKFRVFTCAATDKKVAVNVESVLDVRELPNGTTDIWFTTKGRVLNVAEDFDTVVSRLNTIAE